MRAVLCVLLAAGLQAQVVPPRDTRPTTTSQAITGRSVIRGRVTSADTGRPLARATVSVSAQLGPQEYTASISTDSDGRYELVDLPAGRYEIAATRVGYLDLRYGQRYPRERASTLDVGETVVIDLDFKLPRMSAISGRITDELGEPIAGVLVAAVLEMRAGGRVGGEATRLVTMSANRVGVINNSMLTNAHGEYRLTGLSPGTYRVVARSSERCACPIPGDTATVMYLSTFFPGSITEAGGTPIRLGSAEERTNIDFSLLAGRLATIRGVAVSSRGFPMQVLNIENAEPLNRAIVARVTVSSDGTFEIPEVSPGSYVLHGAHADELARMPIEVTGDDATVLVTARPGWSIAGRVVIDPAATTSLNPARVVVRIGNEPTPARRAVIVASGAATEAIPDSEGRFELSPVFGPTRFHVTVPPGWIVKSATVREDPALAGLDMGGSDLIGAELELPPNSVLSGIEILVTDRVSGVSGVVVDNTGAPSTASAVIVFSEDPNKWWSWTGGIRETRPAQNGTFELDGLPPGRYAIAAVEYVETYMWLDDEYLRSLFPRAQRVTLDEGEHLTSVSLTLVQ